jgi:hypothetical protein
MRRNLFSGTTLSRIALSGVVGALLPAASLWAAPNPATPSAQYLTQINEQTRLIQTQADRLESYLRSGASSATYAAGFTNDMAEGTQKLAALLDEFVSQPGTTNDTRQQVERMKVAVNELEAFVTGASARLDSHAMALRVDSVLASITNIMDRGNLLRTAAQTLAGSN